MNLHLVSPKVIDYIITAWRDKAKYIAPAGISASMIIGDDVVAKHHTYDPDEWVTAYHVELYLQHGAKYVAVIHANRAVMVERLASHYRPRYRITLIYSDPTGLRTWTIRTREIDPLIINAWLVTYWSIADAAVTDAIHLRNGSNGR